MPSGKLLIICPFYDRFMMLSLPADSSSLMFVSVPTNDCLVATFYSSILYVEYYLASLTLKTAGFSVHMLPEVCVCVG